MASLTRRLSARAHAIGSRVVYQSHENELARAGGLAAAVRRDRSQVQRPGDRLDAHQDVPGAARPASSDGRVVARTRTYLVSFLVSFISVHGGRSRAADAR